MRRCAAIWSRRSCQSPFGRASSIGAVSPVVWAATAVRAVGQACIPGVGRPVAPTGSWGAGMLIMGSIAGSTGTPEGFASTAMQNVREGEGFGLPGGGVLNGPGMSSQNSQDMRDAIEGITINVRFQLPNGQWAEGPGTVTTRNSTVEATPAGLAEQANLNRRLSQGQ